MQRKIFRLFISSTFSDFKEERKILQTNVFPLIKEYASKEGYIFQPIDLRWGVSNEAQLDQKTLELCLSEVRACKTNMHPNFLIMIGDRYGWVPLPYAIEQDEFNTLLEKVDNKELLQKWYKLDKNQLPHSYLIQERTGKYKDYDTWVKVEKRLREILQKAVKIVNLPEEQMRKYFLSATEAEVEEGIIPYHKPTEFQSSTLLKDNPDLLQLDPKHIFGFLRKVDETGKQEDMFIPDTDEHEKAKEFNERLKENLIDKNILEVKTQQINKEQLDVDYLQEFEARVIKFLKEQIDTHKKTEERQLYSPLEREQQAQNYYALNKRKGFLKTESLTNLLSDINSYIDSQEKSEPFILYGASGRGKSAFMAQAIEEAENKLKETIVYRFVGATPHANSSQEILISIFKELGVDLRSQEQKEAQENKESFEEFSSKVYHKILEFDKDIVIFIDALDQLQNDDQFLWLPKKLPSNVKIILSVLNDTNYKDDTEYFKNLQSKFDNLHEIAPFSEPVTLLKQLLKEKHRTLSEEQEKYFLKQYTEVNAPLYIVMAAQEIKEWRSDDTQQTLAPTQKGVIEEFISNLFEIHHHDEKFVHKVLGYIYASGDGLSESELLQLLATDAGFIAQMAPETFHKNANHELPLIHWSRLQTALKPFLSIKSKDNEELMYFFHREFEDALKNQAYQQQEHEAIIEATQKKIVQNQDKEFDENRWGKLYITLIAEYELRYQNKEKQKEFAGFIADTKKLNEDWIDKCTNNINSIGYEHGKYNRMFQAIAYQEIFKYATEILHQENPERWAEPYTTSLNNLASSYKNQNRLDEAIALGEQSLKIREALYQENPERWAEDYTTSLNNLAYSYTDQNRLDDAIALEEQSLKIREALYQENPERWAEPYTRSLNNLASSYKNQNRLDEAIALGEQSLKIREALYQENPSRWAEPYTRSLNNLASSYKNQNRLDEAIALGEQSLKIREALYQENPERWAEDYTLSLSNLAISYEEQNRLDETIALEEQSLKITEALYQENPARWAEDYILSLSNLAISYEEQNRLDNAIALIEKILEITKDDDSITKLEALLTRLKSQSSSSEDSI